MQDLTSLVAAVPIDRLHALADGAALPEQAEGSALFADVAGFTALSRRLAAAVGPRRGAEELAGLLERTYTPLIAQIHHYGGSIIGFSGDAMTCWFAGPPAGGEPGGGAAARALTAALRLQEAMASLAGVTTAAGEADLGLKVAVSAGRALRLLIGDPQIQLHDVLAGPVVDRLASAAALATRGEVVADPATAQSLPDRLSLGPLRRGPAGDAIVVAAIHPPAQPRPWPAVAPAGLSHDLLRPWLPAPVGAMLGGQHPGLVAGLRSAVALMLRFELAGLEQPGTTGWINALARRAQAIAAAYGGTLIDVTIGDHGNFLYIAFGAPQAHDDDPARAVACALDLMALEAEIGARLAIGLASGTVRVGLYGGVGRRAYGVIGEPPTLACRLMDAAPYGAIWCAEGVARGARRAWGFAPLHSVAVKGRAEPVAVFQPAGPARPYAPGDTALAGRDHELELLRAACAALSSGQGQTIIVSGEPGIGKTSLALALRQLLAEGGLDGFSGAGVSLGAGGAYHGWLGCFAAILGLDGRAGAAERGAQARARVEELAPALIGRLPLLNELLGLDLPDDGHLTRLDARLRRESLDQLLLALLRARAAAGPIAVVIEDGHWLDSLSWELARELARGIGAEGLPILLLITTRPLDHAHPAMAAVRAVLGLPATQLVPLRALSDASTAALVAARLGVRPEALPAGLLRLVAERSGGNPFFAEELVLDLRERGALRVAAGSVELADAPAEGGISLPETIEALLLARMDRLAPDAQTTLKLAAVVGPTFELAPLRRLREVHAPLEEAPLRNQLRALAAGDFTDLEAPGPRLTYRFRHLLTHEAAYGSLLYAQRRRLHRTVAEWHEAAGVGPQDYSLLAHHYGCAEDDGRERHYAHLAGIHAAEQCANVEAARFLARALALSPEEMVAERYTMLRELEQVHDVLGEREAQQQDLAALEGLAAALDDARRAEVALRRAIYAETTSSYTDSAAYAARAIEFAQAAGSPELRADGHLRLGFASLAQADYPAAMAHLATARELAQAARRPDLEGDILIASGVVAERQGDFAAAYDLAAEALRLCELHGRRREAALALLNMGAAAGYQRKNDLAQGYFERALARFQEIGDRRGQARALMNLGAIYAFQYDWPRAIATMEGARSVYCDVEDRHGAAIAMLNLAITADDLGDFAAARRSYEEGLVMARAIGARHIEVALLRSLAAHHVRVGQHEAAEASARAGLELARAIGAEAAAVRCLSRLGWALIEQQRFAEAEQVYQEAGGRLGAGEDPALGQQIHAGIAYGALRQGDLARALAQIDPIVGALSGEVFDSAAEIIWMFHILTAGGDPRALPLLEASYRHLLRRGERLGEEAALRRFLNATPAHRDTVALYQAHLC